MTFWFNGNVSDRRNGGNTILLFGLIALGWVYALAQVLTIDAAGSLAEAGPGMQVFAYAKAYLFGDPFAFETSVSFCATPTGAWGAMDLIKAMVMWLDMILAMMLPVLAPSLCKSEAGYLPTRTFRAGLAGYVTAWLPLCVAGVVLQWGLQRTGVFNSHYVLQNVLLSAVILTLVALIYLFRLNHVVRAPRFAFSVRHGSTSHPFHAGLTYGLHCLRCCGPLMMVMFVVGLMNILAMIALTVLMSANMLKFSRTLSTYIGVSALVSAIVLAAA